MAGKTWNSAKTRGERVLRRLSVVFAVELRLKIVTELYMREMSPKQFFEEFGGGSISRVTKNFERLAQEGFLRRVRCVGPGGHRRGASEHFYRTTELAIFEIEAWSLLPYSVRVAFSWTILKQLAERVRQALEAGTFDARPDRHRSCTTLQLDRQGWERVMVAVDARFRVLFEEQMDARLRILHSGEKPLTATVALFAFESPRPGSEPATPELLPLDRELLIPFPLRLSKILADQLSREIVAEANLRDVSVKQLHETLGTPPDAIRRRVRLLDKVAWLGMVSEATGGRRRGAVEKFYHATGPAMLDNDPWARLPPAVAESDSWAVFRRFSELVREAIKAGTFDGRIDRIATWSLLLLDREGWAKAIATIEELLAFALAEQGRAAERIGKSGEQPVTITLGLAAFESPKDTVKAP
jgi:hypothetical protein